MPLSINKIINGSVDLSWPRYMVSAHPRILSLEESESAEVAFFEVSSISERARLQECFEHFINHINLKSVIIDLIDDDEVNKGEDVGFTHFIVENISQFVLEFLEEKSLPIILVPSESAIFAFNYDMSIVVYPLLADSANYCLGPDLLPHGLYFFRI